MSRMYVSLVERYPVARPCTDGESATRCGLRTLRRRVGLSDQALAYEAGVRVERGCSVARRTS